MRLEFSARPQGVVGLSKYGVLTQWSSLISTYFSKGYSGCGVENSLEVPGVNGRLLLQVMSRAERNASNSSGTGKRKHLPEPLSEHWCAEHYFIHCIGHRREATWPLYTECTAHQQKETFSTL